MFVAEEVQTDAFGNAIADADAGSGDDVEDGIQAFQNFQIPTLVLNNVTIRNFLNDY